MMINASAISYQRAGSIPAGWLTAGAKGRRFNSDLICDRKDDNPCLTLIRHIARGHGKVHVNRSKIPIISDDKEGNL